MKNATVTKKIRTYWDRERLALSDFGPSKAKQEMAAECDVNLVIKRHQEQGIVPYYNQMEPHYGDFSEVVDYHSALESVIHAQSAFMALPAETRARFGNDPALLMAFLQDEKNYDEALALGLVKERPQAPTDAVAAPPSEAKAISIER